MTKPYYLDPEDENYISKTDIKREVKELQEFADQLTKLGKSLRAQLTVSDAMKEGFLLADKIANKPDALRRHMQYMTKILKDEDVELLKAEYARLKSPHKGQDKLIKQLETLRDELIEQGDERINALLESQPQFERQKLRQLIRQAKKELAKEKPGKSFKELFQYLKSEYKA